MGDRLTRSIYAALSRALGGAPRALTESEIAKLSPDARRQLLHALTSLENKRPTRREMMREIAMGRVIR